MIERDAAAKDSLGIPKKAGKTRTANECRALKPSTAIFLCQSSSSSVNPTLRVTW
jgi:hypothetical protein